jgi:recombination protein RecR
VVENLRDLIAIESTGQFNGVYHVLGGIISPIDGIGPEHIHIESLVNRVSQGGISEIIMALSPTIEGDTTVFYISKRLQAFPVIVTTLARGVAFGADLEYTDELTLARSIATRQPYENQLARSS